VLNVQAVGAVSNNAYSLPVGSALAPPLRQNRDGSLAVSEVFGKYYLTNYDGLLYTAQMATGVIYPAPASTASLPWSLYNPVTSTKNLVLVYLDFTITTISGTPLTGIYGLYVNTNPAAAATTGTAITTICNKIGNGANPVGQALSTSTVPAAPSLFRPIMQKITGEVATVFPNPGLATVHIEFDGTCIITPGTTISTEQTIADTTNATVTVVACWAELPV
jgi:hypothetical protein